MDGETVLFSYGALLIWNGQGRKTSTEDEERMSGQMIS